MASIRKIALTPLKWVSKQFVHRTLLRFPGGDAHDPVVCAFCPEMCRFSCPAAVSSGNDAVTPRGMMSLLYKEKNWPGKAGRGAELWPIYACTGCGRCTEYCVYSMPVADKLLEARREHRWSKAVSTLDTLPEELDPAGDLAAEWREDELAEARLRKFLAAAGSRRAVKVVEPKTLHYLKGHGVTKAELDWDPSGFSLDSTTAVAVRDRLADRRWLVVESPWLSRRLDRAADVEHLCGVLERAGVKLVRPYHKGRDCIDSGGEGAYRTLFPKDAARMALDVWERDENRAEAVLTFSDRAAVHFRQALGPGVPVVSVRELLIGKGV